MIKLTLLTTSLLYLTLCAFPASAAEYYVSPQGSDTSSGSLQSPWRTMDLAVRSLRAGDTLYVRQGTYETINDAWRFNHSGTETSPITVRNYAGEQAIFKINTTKMEHRAFRCQYNPSSPSIRQTSPANYIRLLGSDLPSPRPLSNGVSSQKGLVVLGLAGANAVGIESIGPYCNNWEVAGFDFIETGGGIFQRSGPSESWKVHDNRVYNYYRESGMQFNGNYNEVYQNQIYLINSLPRTYGCQTLNFLGHHNHAHDNYLTRGGSTHRCIGVLFEWDLADDNLIERNTLEDFPVGMTFEGGDRNTIQHNTLRASGNGESGFNLKSYPSSHQSWPCNESSSSFSSLLPPNDPAHPNYQYYYPRNCNSSHNRIVNNSLTGFAKPYQLSSSDDGTNQISLSVSTPPSATPSTAPRAGDLNRDGRVNLYDFNLLVTNYGNPYTLYDFNAIVTNFSLL